MWNLTGQLFIHSLSSMILVQSARFVSGKRHGKLRQVYNRSPMLNRQLSFATPRKANSMNFSVSRTFACDVQSSTALMIYTDLYIHSWALSNWRSELGRFWCPHFIPHQICSCALWICLISRGEIYFISLLSQYSQKTTKYFPKIHNIVSAEDALTWKPNAVWINNSSYQTTSLYRKPEIKNEKTVLGI